MTHNSKPGQPGKGKNAMTTYLHFRELVEISAQEVGVMKYYNVKGISMVDHIIQNAAHQMTENAFWNFSARIGEEF